MSKKFLVIIPLANSQAERDLITMGAAVARHQRGEAVALNILLPSTYGMGGLSAAAKESLLKEQNDHLKDSCRHTKDLGITVTPVTLFSSTIQDTILQEARDRGANLVIMGWSKPTQTPGAVMGSILDKVAAQAPADVAIFRGRGLGDKRILLSTAGGPESHLGGQIAAGLQSTMAASVTLLHLVRVKEDMGKGKDILAQFAKKYGLKAKRIIKTREDFTAGILEESKFYDLIIVGRSQAGLFKKIFSRTIPEKVAEQADCSVLVTHRYGRLPLMTRFFGYRGN
jgi:formate-nitrite transporter family protein